MFVEPLLAMVVTDFTNRVCTLRNERQIASKMEPMNYLIAAISMVRLIGALPEIFAKRIEDTSILITMEGATYYRNLSESANFNNLIDATSLVISLTLMAFIHRWLKTKLLTILWLLKFSIQVALILFGVSFSYLLLDTITLLNILILYNNVNIQTLLYDVEDSREKLDRFFSYNFLFFEDD